MYKLFTDKPEVFECNIQLEGASLKNSQARLIIESEDVNLLFNGSITADGKCTIPIKKLKNLLESNTKGEIKLEVIAEDTYFVPWKSNFVVEASKKVTVEIKSQDAANIIAESTPKVQVSGIKNQTKASPAKRQVPNSIREHVTKLVKMLVRGDINVKNLYIKKDKVNNIIATYLQENKVAKDHVQPIINGILTKLPQ